MTESEKMKLGLWYDANYDQELSEEREKAEDLYFTFNHTACLLYTSDAADD